ncbi:MAG TPA: BatD family protein [Saprospiraceae bacterium]|nr:BatD family protein [Saprospiraceae bacterium]MCB9271910.1 BatD family protein [Lewinellaceae bacterium]HPG07676.1 BatD family protein [Saprospiraceae bacterium]HPQ98780.1 BatD family protein [Saprospiraceae bacterium]HQU53230.1 BatD family protein [Saprospiraceae bacterium]
MVSRFRHGWILGLLLTLGSMSSAQEVEVYASVSQDTVLIGTPFEVSFTLINGQGSWQLPELAGLQILSGPNRSTQIQIVNGAMSKQSVDGYVVRATDLGDYVIERATIEVDGQLYETEPIILHVTDNPDQVSPAKQPMPMSLFGDRNPAQKQKSKPSVLQKYPKKKF